MRRRSDPESPLHVVMLPNQDIGLPYYVVPSTSHSESFYDVYCFSLPEHGLSSTVCFLYELNFTSSVPPCSLLALEQEPLETVPLAQVLSVLQLATNIYH